MYSVNRVRVDIFIKTRENQNTPLRAPDASRSSAALTCTVYLVRLVIFNQHFTCSLQLVKRGLHRVFRSQCEGSSEKHQLTTKLSFLSSCQLFGKRTVLSRARLENSLSSVSRFNVSRVQTACSLFLDFKSSLGLF